MEATLVRMAERDRLRGWRSWQRPRPRAGILPPATRERVAAPPFTGWGYGGTIPRARILTSSRPTPRPRIAMPAPTRPAARLTHAAALTVLQAVIARAEAIGVPENVAVVDADGNVLAFLRMEGAKLLSRESARAKAVTAASNGAATGRLPADLAVTVALASGGRLTDLPGACRS